MPYQALYRQWRPKNFSQMVGQKAIVETLRNQVIHDRIAHAYLFCGSRGTGKTSTAKILAKAINCEHPENGDPCGVCETCRRQEREETLDIIEIDAASNNGVDEMRELRDTVKYPPQYGRYKVYIIDEVHMLSTSAFNALLKTLEEPPAHVVFILATTEPQKLPETILSRCQRFDFGRLSLPEMTGRLREAAEGSGASATDGALMAIARAAEGGMRDALSLLDICLGYSDHVDEQLVRSVLGTSDRGFLFDFGDALSEEDAGRVFRMIDELMRSGRDPAVFAREISQHVRALLMAKVCPEDLGATLDLTAEDAAEFIKQAERFSVTRLMKILDLFMGLETEMRYASAPRLALENVSLKCCLRTGETDAQAFNDRIAELEKQLTQLRDQIAGMTLVPAGAAMAAPQGQQAGVMKEPAARPSVSPKSAPAQKQVTLETSAAWKELMNRFKKSDMSLWSMLSQGGIVSCENEQFRWQANQAAGEEVFLRPLEKPERKEKIASTLSEITGKTCAFLPVRRDAAPPSDTASETAYLDAIYNTFGQEAVIIQS